MDLVLKINTTETLSSIPMILQSAQLKGHKASKTRVSSCNVKGSLAAGAGEEGATGGRGGRGDSGRVRQLLC